MNSSDFVSFECYKILFSFWGLLKNVCIHGDTILDKNIKLVLTF